jgi:holliday junction DNA helicase RuvA
MIRSLTGEIAHANENYVTINVRGVGYLVGTTVTQSGLKVGDSVTLHTHLAVRETALDLYGFTTMGELDIFELLLTVPKVGPKSALQILTQASPSLLLEAISKKDAGYLHKLSGIGKKTCENLVASLYDKVEGVAFATEVPLGVGLSEAEIDAIDALVSLGYDLSTARETVKNLSGTTANELVSQALKQI